MKKVILLLALSLGLNVLTVFAQTETKKFLGTWQLADTGNKWLQKRGVKAMTINVSEDDGKLIIERSGQTVKNALTTSTDVYEIDEDTDVSLIGGRLFGGVQYRRLRFLDDNKLQLLTSVKRDTNTEISRATWTVSEDGKTLTIRQETTYSSVNVPAMTSRSVSSSKMIFTKQ